MLESIGQGKQGGFKDSCLVDKDYFSGTLRTMSTGLTNGWIGVRGKLGGS